ncbi:MAG: hypothetical protein MI921_22555 [Cytophagales bacterium]|nr:hypothetical protein [Cytophagales bacterium]
MAILEILNTMGTRRILLIFAVFMHPMVFAQTDGLASTSREEKYRYQKEHQDTKRYRGFAE